MALIVEDGSIVANAESYVSVAQADSYFSTRANEAWSDVEDKEAALRKATDYMLQAYRSRWAGTRVSITQVLDWPRAWVPIPDLPSGYGAGASYLENNIVPTEVKNACAELALLSVSGALAPNLERAKSSVTVGEIAVTYDPASPEYPRYRSIDMMLSPWLKSGGAMMGLVRT